MEDERPLDIRQVKTVLTMVVESLDELLVSDLSNVVVSSGWSRVPHAGDHIQFIRDMAAKLHDNLSPVVAPEISVKRGEEDGHSDDQDGDKGHVL